MNRIKTYRRYDRGRDIAVAGTVSSHLGSIVSGCVRLSQSLPDGRRQLVGLQFASDFVGRAFRTRLEYDVTAATDVLLCVFERGPFEELMEAAPSLKTRLLEMTMDELDSARARQLLLGRKTAREKVASFLLQLAKRQQTLGSDEQADISLPDIEVALPLTRGEIAEYLGLTIETVSRQLAKLRGDGVIDFQGARSFHVSDAELLFAESGAADYEA